MGKIAIGTGNSFKEIQRIYVGDNNGKPQEVRKIYIGNTNNVPKLVFGNMVYGYYTTEIGGNQHVYLYDSQSKRDNATETNINWFEYQFNDTNFLKNKLGNNGENIRSITIDFSKYPITIPKRCFDSYENLTTIKFTKESKINYISHQAFYNLSSLQELFLPSEIRAIAWRAFDITNINDWQKPTLRYYGNCNDWCSINWEKYISEEDIEYSTFKAFDEVTYQPDSSSEEFKTFTDITISAQDVSQYAFFACPSLSSVFFSKSIKTLGRSIFSRCEALKNITFEARGKITTLPKSIFDSCSSLGDIVLPYYLEKIEDYAFNRAGTEGEWKSVAIPKTLESSGNYAFYAAKIRYVKYEGSIYEWEALKEKSGVYALPDYQTDTSVEYDCEPRDIWPDEAWA